MINHFNAITLRIKGSGSLIGKLYSLDDVNTQNLVDLTLVSSTNRSYTRLCNFKEERAAVEFKVSVLDENFIVNSITVFVKPVATSYPE